MPKASNSKYRKFARLVYSGYSCADAGVAAGIHKNKAVANKLAHKLVVHPIVAEETKRLTDQEDFELIMSKREKLEKSALLSRKVAEVIETQFEPDDDGKM